MFESIADYLLDANKEKVPGLLVGNTGVCLFLYQVYRKTEQVKYGEAADVIIEAILEKKMITSSTNFRDGLAGIGWGIIFFLQHNHCEGDPDEILEDVDNSIFRIINESKNLPLSTNDGLCGYLLYLNNRLNKAGDKSTLNYQINCELFKLLINKIDKIAPESLQAIAKDMQFDLLWQYPVLLAALSQSMSLNIYNDKIKNMINQWMIYLETSVPSIHCHRLSLSLALYFINKHIHSSDIDKQIRVLLFSIDFEKIKSEINPYETNITYGWAGVAWLLAIANKYLNADYPNYHFLNKTRCDIVRLYLNDTKILIDNLKKETKEKPIPIGVMNGITGIGLLDLCFPEALSIKPD